MAETRFIKAVPFGGYDKEDVDKRLELLYDQIYELKNELRETKLILKKYEEGSDSEKAFENAIAVERGMLTQLQVKNATLSEKNKALAEDNKLKEKEIADLNEKITEMSAQLEENSLTIATLKSSSSAEALSLIFVEAQKSHDLLIDSAKKEAETLETSSKQFAEDLIVDANNKASKTIYDAERQAAEIIAEAKTSSEQMSAASGNLKAVMLNDINKLSSEMSKLRELLDNFEKQGLDTLEASEKLLKEAGNEIKNGGVPVFKDPQKFDPEYPEEPVYETLPSKASQEKAVEEKKNAELDKLQAMAESIGGGKKAAPDLDEIAKKAAAIGGEKSESKPAEKSDGGKKKPDLAELAKQAAAIEGNKPKADAPKKEEKKKGGIDLAALAQQAAALDK